VIPRDSFLNPWKHAECYDPVNRARSITPSVTIVIAVGFAIVFLLLPYGVGWLIAAVALTALAVIILLPKYLRRAQ